MKHSLKSIALLMMVAFGNLSAAEVSSKPNIIYVLCDDLGYGDVKCVESGGPEPGVGCAAYIVQSWIVGPKKASCG